MLIPHIRGFFCGNESKVEWNNAMPETFLYNDTRKMRKKWEKRIEPIPLPKETVL